MKNKKILIFPLLILICSFFCLLSSHAANFGEKLKGKILLQVESKGEAWYVYPINLQRYYLGKPDDAFDIMRKLGLGITNNNLNQIPIGFLEKFKSGIDQDNDGLSDNLEIAIETNQFNSDSDGDGYNDKAEILNGYNPKGSGKILQNSSLITSARGKILLQVEKNGEAWYLNPVDSKRYYLGRPIDAFNVMRELGLGVTNLDLAKVGISADSKLPVQINIQVLQQGCLYNNPSCVTGYKCVNNICQLSQTEEQPAQKNGQEHADTGTQKTDATLLNTSLTYSLSTTYDGAGACSETVGLYFCPANYQCKGLFCKLPTGCEYGNQICAKGYVCANGQCTNSSPEKKQQCSNAECLTTNIDYLIISRSLFEYALQDFIAWKQAKGYKVGFATVDYINDTFSGIHTAEKMKNYIKAAKSVKYVLLVGDTKVEVANYQVTNSLNANYVASYSLDAPWNVPIGHVIASGEGQEAAASPSDIYFADLDDWDVDNDGINDWQPIGNYQIDFEVMVGRWPVRTPFELSRIINKTKQLVPASSMNFWIWQDWYDPEIIKFCQQTKPYTLLDYQKPEMGSGAPIACVGSAILDPAGIPYKYNYVFTAQEQNAFVNALFNASEAFYESFHGGQQTFIQGLNTTMMYKFKNIIPFFSPYSCTIGTYYDGDIETLAEAFLKAKKGPANFIIPTNTKYFYLKITQGKTIGEAFYPEEPNQWQTVVYGTMLLGDPSLVVFK
ncbi:hypothetical protein HY932_00850 [Candidatus Falkowbacteria bacterium]|nr:hypothetical protein [Candidatus Falkowbacteria bacterium]